MISQLAVQPTEQRVQIPLDPKWVPTKMPKLSSPHRRRIVTFRMEMDSDEKDALEGRMRSNAHPPCPVAVLFSGGARDVHMTARSILKHMIAPLGTRRCCIFIRSLLDPDAHKLSTLLSIAGDSVVHTRVWTTLSG